MKIVFACEMSILPPGQNAGGTEQAVACLNRELTKLGHDVVVISGACIENKPKYRSKYAWLCETLDSLGKLDVVNITTQGPLGFLVRRYCVARKIPFTVAYHTRIPEYLQTQGFPIGLSRLYIRWFLNGASRVIAPTASMAEGLRAVGVKNAVGCAHGVDTESFKPGDKTSLDHLGLPRPYWLFVGRVTEVKNIEAFLRLELEGTKVVVGDGPLRAELQEKYSAVHFAGTQRGEALASYFDAADVFVFPSRTDTFGLVLLEALSAGIPVAAYPVTGPIDVITDRKVGCLDEDLGRAARSALKLCSCDCRKFAERHSWCEATKQFLSLQPAAGSPQGGAFRLWFEQKVNLPMMLLESLVDRVNRLLFSEDRFTRFLRAVLLAARSHLY